MSLRHCAPEARATVGASFTALTVMVKVLTGAPAHPAVVGAPVVSDLDTYCGHAESVRAGWSVPLEATEGCVENKAGLVLLVTSKLTVWPGPVRASRDVGGPVEDTLRPGVLILGLVGTLGEARCVVH